MDFLTRLAAKYLNPQRRRYPFLVGVMLWAGWLLSIGLGRGELDLAGQVVGTDYLVYYAAGTAVRIGESARLYDVAHLMQLQQAIIGPQLRNYYALLTPPFMVWPFVPLSALPYQWSFAVWSAIGLAALWLSLRLLAGPNPHRIGLWALTFFPVFAAVSYGQNSLLSLLLLSLTYWLRHRGRPLAAGLTASLLLYKPQLLMGVALLWLLEAIWNGGRVQAAGSRFRADLTALFGLACGGGLLVALCLWQMPEASRAYATFARTVLPNLPAYMEFPLWNLHTLWGFWRLLLRGAPSWADALYWLGAAAGLIGFVLFWRRYRSQPALSFAAAICVTLWITPHAMIYDWTLLLIPAVLLWQAVPEHRDSWTAVFALLWVAAFVSGPLTRVQLAMLPIAIQISVPALLASLWLVGRRLCDAPVHERATLGGS